jgi:hypothetical protein
MICAIEIPTRLLSWNFGGRPGGAVSIHHWYLADALHLRHNRGAGTRGQSMGLDEQIKARCYNVNTKTDHNETNNDKSNSNEISRRGFLELGSAAVTGVAGVLAMTGMASAQELVPGVKTGKSTHLTDPGPTDKHLDAANPDISLPPPTDGGGLATFKYPFSFSNRRVYEGGWSREVPVRELPVSKTIAGVDMRLTAGGIREMHWHTAAEWAIMLYGSARITAIDDEGRSFVRDTHEGSLVLSDRYTPFHPRARP